MEGVDEHMKIKVADREVSNTQDREQQAGIMAPTSDWKWPEILELLASACTVCISTARQDRCTSSDSTCKQYFHDWSYTSDNLVLTLTEWRRLYVYFRSFTESSGLSVLVEMVCYCLCVTTEPFFHLFNVVHTTSGLQQHYNQAITVLAVSTWMLAADTGIYTMMHIKYYNLQCSICLACVDAGCSFLWPQSTEPWSCTTSAAQRAVHLSH